MKKLWKWWRDNSPLVTRRRMQNEVGLVYARLHDETQAARKTRALLEIELATLSKVEVGSWHGTHILTISVAVARSVLMRPRAKGIFYEVLCADIIKKLEKAL